MKPFLSAKHRKARVEFAKAHVSWTNEQWNNVIWTDESSFQTGKLHGRPKAWRRAQDKLRSEYLVPSFKSDRKSQMVWGAITGGGCKSKLVFMDPNRRDAQGFVDQVYDGPLMEFMDTIQEAWDRIKAEQITKCVANMRERLEAVIRARGGPTRY